jgi:hypothetical protein
MPPTQAFVYAVLIAGSGAGPHVREMLLTNNHSAGVGDGGVLYFEFRDVSQINVFIGQRQG